MYTREDLSKQTELLITMDGITIKKLAEGLGVEYKTLCERIKRGSFTYVDYINLLDFLGYEIILQKKQ